MVTAECNLRCRYCYVPRKSSPIMPPEYGRRAIERALNSLAAGGRLELGFFGGEPLLAPAWLHEMADYAARRCRQTGHSLAVQVSTNATAAGGDAWTFLLRDDVQVAVSCDGPPDVHDRNRRTISGAGSWRQTAATLRRLLAAGREPWALMVVGPNTVAALPRSVRFLADMGARTLQPSLDLWTRWSAADLGALEQALGRCADLWRQASGRLSIGWFDEMAAAMAGIPRRDCARCGFGAGQVAVTPSGRLYPCERLVGGDESDGPWRLEGHVATGDDFLGYLPSPSRSDPACDRCTIRAFCSTTCRCSNIVRTGDPARPDRLLCHLNQVCFRELCRVLDATGCDDPKAVGPSRTRKDHCYESDRQSRVSR